MPKIEIPQKALQDLQSSKQRAVAQITGFNRREEALRRVFGACLLGVSLGLAVQASAQGVPGEAAPPPGATATGNLARWSGSLPESAGRTAEIRFALYQDQAGGLALWSETQTVKVGADGRYSVLLGASNAEGLPPALFQAGEARWLEARPASGSGGDAAGQRTSATAPPRSLVAAVPYAFKSVDADTLAGRSAADYVTREDLKAAAAAGAWASPQLHPEATPTGSGTAGYVPLWTGASTLGNSVIKVSGSNVGIGAGIPVYPLDVNGAATVRGVFRLEGNTATATAGAPSPSEEFQASSYSSTSHAAVSQYFTWQLQPSGNNTAGPAAKLMLSTGSGSTSVKPTGLSIDPTGQITFAAGQTFPGTGKGTITGVTATSPLAGGGTTGAVTVGLNTAALETTLNGVYPQLHAANTFTKPITFAPGQTFPGSGTITGVTVSSPLTGGGTSGAIPLGLNTAALEATLNGAYPRLATSNTFQQGASFGAAVFVSSYDASAPALTGFGGEDFTPGVSGQAGDGIGVEGTSDDGIGVWGNSNIPAQGDAGVMGTVQDKFSKTYNNLVTRANPIPGPGALPEVAGVWGDASGDLDNLGLYGAVGVLGTADDDNGGAFFNNSQTYFTVYAVNQDASGGQAGGIEGIAASGIGVSGIVLASGAQQAGVVGEGNAQSVSFSANTIEAGVWGDDGTASVSGGLLNVGVAGTADDSSAGYFNNNSATFPTVFAANNGGGTTGLFRTLMAVSKDGTCGFGSGGSLTCTGQIKALATTGSGTRKVETYAMQSPENWMEDFGSGELQRGVAVVRIDPAFAETVTADASYHVFITPNGDSKGLYVIRKTPASFEVRESGGGVSSLSFDYRIVARRRGYEAQRLTDVTERFNAESAAATPAKASGILRKPGLQPQLLRKPGRPATPRLPAGRRPAARHTASVQREPALQP